MVIPIYEEYNFYILKDKYRIALLYWVYFFKKNTLSLKVKIKNIYLGF